MSVELCIESEIKFETLTFDLEVIDSVYLQNSQILLLANCICSLLVCVKFCNQYICLKTARIKMPETSQDAFEMKHPNSLPTVVTTDSRLPRANATNVLQPDHLNVDDVDRQRQPRKSRISFTDLDSCIGGPDIIYGYKRESSHR